MSDKKSFEDFSRDELLKICKEMQNVGINMSNHPPTARCPFCYGTTVVPSLKGLVKGHLIVEWHKDVTQDEYDAWWEENMRIMKEGQ
jgi:hypothetical protein